MQFNIQELATVRFQRIPTTIFVISNGGYSSIKNTQKQFLEARYAGVDLDSGLWIPELELLARAYGFEYRRINSDNMSQLAVEQFMHSAAEAMIVEVDVSPDQVIAPTQGFTSIGEGRFGAASLSNMSPECDWFHSSFEVWFGSR